MAVLPRGLGPHSTGNLLSALGLPSLRFLWDGAFLASAWPPVAKRQQPWS